MPDRLCYEYVGRNVQADFQSLVWRRSDGAEQFYPSRFATRYDEAALTETSEPGRVGQALEKESARDGKRSI